MELERNNSSKTDKSHSPQQLLESVNSTLTQLTNAEGKRPREIKSENTKSILKKEENPKNKMRIFWDEDNLIYNDSHKTATMKINEPKTPYNKDYKYSEEEEEGCRVLVPHSPTSSEGIQWHELENSLKKAEQEQKNSPSNSTSDVDSSSDKEDKGLISDESSDETFEFKQKRKQHYDEFQTLLKWKQHMKNGQKDEE